MWGNQPWDNDTAADWFAKLLEKTNMAVEARQTLELVHPEAVDVEQTPVLRAAAYCVLQFGHVFVWPIDYLEQDLILAVQALEKVLEDEEYCYSIEITTQVRGELEELKDRLEKFRNNT